MSMTLQTDLAQAERFLMLLDEEAEQFCFRTFTDDKANKPNPDPLAQIHQGTFADLAPRLTALNQRGAGVFVTVNATDGRGGKKENIVRVRALWQECDHGDEPTLPVEPHMSVESSPGNRHHYILVDGLPIDLFGPAQQRLVDDYGSDPSAKDLPRILRLPGFYHLKDPAKPHLVRLIHESGRQPTPWAKLREVLPPVLKAKPADAKPGRASPDRDGLLKDLLQGDNVHESALKIVAKLIREGWPDDFIRITCTALAEGVAQARGPERAKVLLGSELDRMIDGARSKRFAPEVPVDGPALLALAKDLTPDTDTETIQDLIQQAASLPKLAKRRVWEAVKKATGIPLGVLKDAENEGREAGEVVDQLSLAQGIRAAIGPENVIGQESGTWIYQAERGIWRPLEVREERQLVQSHLEEAKADGRLDEVGKGLVDGVTDLLKSEAYQAGHLWDLGHDEAVSTPGGVLVLAEAGRWSLQPHRREDFRTVQVPVSWNPQAEAPRFKQFLAEVFAPDADGKAKAQALLEMMGYSLMAHARHEKFIILVGEGANGKSVLLSVLERLIGPENTAGVQPSQFDRGFQRAHLHLKLANIVTEVKQGETIADAELKGITSGEPSTVERKFQHPFTMRPFATCWFGTNHLPHTRDFSFALFRRALVVRFNRKFTPGVDADPQLKDKLFAELPGILRLCLEAYGEAVFFGQFTEPASCIEAKQEWRMEADQAAQFLAEQCREGGEIGSTDLFRAYLDWADSQGIKQRLSHKSFTDRVIRLGYGKAKRIQGIYFQNLHLTPLNEAHWESYRRA